MGEKIAGNIKSAHDRVADTYGISQVHQDIAINSYDGWNLTHNIVKPLTTITSLYWKEGHILDAGCGNGQIAAILLEQGVSRITGVDFSLNMLRNAACRIHRLEKSQRFSSFQANLDSLGMIKSGFFDGAILFGVIEHLDEPAKVIMEIWRGIKAGGVFAIAIPRKGSLSHLTYLAFGDSPKRWGTMTHWWDRFRLSEKASYYRFFSLKEVNDLFPLPDMEILDRIPFAYSHLDGFPGSFLHAIGRNRMFGHGLLTRLNKICRAIKCIPGGEFWIIRKCI
ncbi:class I SAM-dependent methyltransferase [bacterium]|nr:class I SAM-dependent methyltransferase [candidate division CSSED10-310 bacterium]